MVVSEVLLALQGLSGDYLVVGGEKGENGLWGAVADRFHPSERQLLKRLCVVGAAYRTVSDFVEQTALGSSLHGGMYMRALGGGLARQLQGYRAVLIRLEKELRAGEFPPLLTYLTNAVDEVRQRAMQRTWDRALTCLPC